LIGMYYITLLTEIGIYSIAALGLNITMGYAGQVNLGQAAFVGIGAITSALLTLDLHLSFWIGFLAAGLMSLLIGVLLGAVSIRLKHDFLAITTIGFNFIVVGVFEYYSVFGGTTGLIGIPPPRILGHSVWGFNFMVLVYIILALAAAGTWWIEKSWLGRAFQAIREDEEAAQTMGIDPRKYKILAFAIGAALAGFSGSLLAHFKTSITYQNFGFDKSIEILTMSILGGMDSIPGAITGAAVVKLLPEVFRPFVEYRLVVYSIVIVLVLVFMPQGILGKNSPLLEWLRGGSSGERSNP